MSCEDGLIHLGLRRRGSWPASRSPPTCCSAWCAHQTRCPHSVPQCFLSVPFFQCPLLSVLFHSASSSALYMVRTPHPVPPFSALFQCPLSVPYMVRTPHPVSHSVRLSVPSFSAHTTPSVHSVPSFSALHGAQVAESRLETGMLKAKLAAVKVHQAQCPLLSAAFSVPPFQCPPLSVISTSVFFHCPSFSALSFSAPSFCVFSPPRCPLLRTVLRAFTSSWPSHLLRATPPDL